MSKWTDEQAFERGLDVGTEDSSPLRGTWPEYVAKAWSDDAFPKGKCILIGRRILDLEAELEVERMRLAACGVVAVSNTPETAAKARSMHAGYRSASCDEVAKAVDREMAMRVELAAMRPVVEAAELWSESWAPGLLDATLALNAAVDAYRAQREGK